MSDRQSLALTGGHRTVHPVRAHRCRRSRPDKAFTILELMVSLVLTAAMVLIMVRWVGLSAQLSANGASNAGNERTLMMITSEFARDAENAQPCDGQRRSAMFYQAGPSKVVLYRDTDGNGSLELVTWRLTGPGNSHLVREVAPTAADGCTPAAGTFAATLITDRVRAGTTSMFVPRVNGSDVPLTSTIACNLVPSQCNWQAMGLRVVLEPAGGGQPLTLDEVFKLNWETLRLPVSQIGSVAIEAGDVIVSDVGLGQRALGDFDMRALLRPESWATGQVQAIAAHGEEAPNLGWRYQLTGTGQLQLQVSTNGSTWGHTFTSSAIGVPDGTASWARVTFEHGVNSGMEQATVKFYKSSNGVTWTEIGSASTPGRLRVYNPPVPVRVGCASSTTPPGVGAEPVCDPGAAGAAYAGDIFEVTMAGSSNVASNGWFRFEADTDGFADSWAGYASPAQDVMEGSVSAGGGPDDNPYQRFTWGPAGGEGTTASSRVGLVLNGGSLASNPANNCSQPAGGTDWCMWPNSRYVVSFKARALGGPVGSRMTAQPGAGANNYEDIQNPPLTDGWQTYEMRFDTLASFSNAHLMLLTESFVDKGTLDIAMVQVEQIFPSDDVPAWPYATPPGLDDPSGQIRVFWSFRALDVVAGSRTSVGGGGEVWTVPADAEFTFV